MAIDRETFFTYVRRAPFGGRLTSAQVEGLERILAEWERRRLSDKRFLAYMLATGFHETGGKMQPVRENLNYTSAEQIRRTWPSRFPTIESARPYVRQPQKLANKVYGGRLGNTGPNDGWIYRGDGLPQLTGKDNFTRFGVKPGMDLATAVRVMFDGMLSGGFTGRKLGHYFNATVDDPEGARRIVNGTDKAKLIAGYHKAFLDALQAADEATPLPPDISAEEATPDDVPPAESKSLWSMLLSLVTGGGGLAFLNGINSWPAVVALALLVLAGGVGAWLVATGRITIQRRPS